MGLIAGAACGVLFTQLLAAAADRISLPKSPHSGSAGTAVVILLTVPLTFAAGNSTFVAPGISRNQLTSLAAEESRRNTHSFNADPFCGSPLDGRGHK
jgi:hypothetical protein